eukprot:Gb_10291 [translate_table: standard]
MYSQVDIYFNKHKKLQKEVRLQKNQDIQIHLIDCLTGRVEQIINVPVNLYAVHSKFKVVPKGSIHFGSELVGRISEPRTLKIINTGEFPFSFKLFGFAHTNATVEPTSTGQFETREEIKTKKGLEKTLEREGSKGKKTVSAPDTLDLKSFTLSPASGTIQPSSTQEISVYFKAETAGSVSEKIRLAISERDPLKYPEDIIYDISGVCCIPGIATDPKIIFEEHHIVDALDVSSSIPPYGTYSRKDNLFSFGAVVLCFEDSTVVSQASSQVAGNAVESRFKMENPFSVPCSLQLSITRPLELNSQVTADTSLCMEIFPQTMDIPPLEHRYVTCLFRPTSMHTYSAILDVSLNSGDDSQTCQFKCELRGEGTLPHLYIESPSVHSPSGCPWLRFPRLLVGKSFSLPVVFHNKGSVSATARIQTTHEDLEWLQISYLSGEMYTPLDSDSTFTIPSQGNGQMLVTFTPIAEKQFSKEIQLFVDQNPFDRPCILASGEGYNEEIVFVGLPHDFDNEIWFEDCPIGSSVSVRFSMKNNSDKHWRFAWPEIPWLKFCPSSGHLPARMLKDISVKFSPMEAIEYIDHEIKLQFCNILYGGNLQVEGWDDMSTCSAPSTSSRGSLPASSLSPECKVEPAYEVVKGSNKTLLLRLHAIADDARYECDTKMINFKSTMMFQTRRFTFSLRNLSRASMEFLWLIQMPDENIDMSDFYQVSPSKGSVRASDSVDITVKFCPTEVEDCLRMLVCQIPNLDAAYQPLVIPLNGQVSRPWCHFELPRSDYAMRRNPNLPQLNGTMGPLDSSINIIEFESLGPNIRNIKYITALNPTNVSYKFIWEPQRAHQAWTEYAPDPLNSTQLLPDPFKCLTRSGEIISGQKYEMAFEYFPTKIELQESFWIFKIPEKNITVSFLLVGNTKKPELSLDLSVINFGPILVGMQAKHVVNLSNPETIPFAFTFDKLSYTAQSGYSITKPILEFRPSTGVIPSSSVLPIEVVFSPTSEGNVNVNAVCNIKKAKQVSINIKGEGHLCHEKVYLDSGIDGTLQELSPKEINNIDFGEVLVNDKIFKRIIISNTGTFPFQFMWNTANSNILHIEPLAGRLDEDEQITCDLSLSPKTPKALIEIPISCQMMHGSTYSILLQGSCYRPKVKFNFSQYDFGPCFLYHPGQMPASTLLEIANEGTKDVTCVSLFENTDFLEVEHINVILAPYQVHSVRVTFRPNQIACYKETLRFKINGLDTVNILVSGEGVPVLVELVDPRQKQLTFKTLRFGQMAKQMVHVVNKSKIAVSLSFDPSKESLERFGVICYPQEGLQLASRQTGTIEVQYAPHSRMSSFLEGLVVSVGGAMSHLLSISGACLATDVKLSSNIMPFDMVTLGSRVTRKLQLENCGDLGANFSWDTTACLSEFSIVPKDGFLPPHKSSTIDIIFHPTCVNPDVRIEHIPCLITGGNTLYLTVMGGCTECDSFQEILKFKTPVRTMETKSLQLQNDTGEDWTIHPKIINEFWSGATSLVVPAKTTISYDLTYKPQKMCASSTEPHTGSILFPLPDGSAIFYKLSGEAGPPLPENSIKYEVKARSSFVFNLPVRNWLRSTQHFTVVVEWENPDTSNTLKGPKNFDVPGLSAKDCQFHFHALKAGKSEATVTFSHKESGEFLFFVLSFVVSKADIVQQLFFNCFVRQRVVQMLHITNPLEESVLFLVNCSDPEVSVPSSLEVRPRSTATVEVAYRSLFERNTSSMLVFDSDLLGEYSYELKLKSIDRILENPLSFSISLGNQQIQAFRFKHYLPAKTIYNCEISQEGLDAGFRVEPCVSAAAAGPEGMELSVQVTFEPYRVAENLEGILTVQSTEAGEYRCRLHGACCAPSPQGPIIVKGEGQISFKNVFPSAVHFSFSVDNPSFSCSKGEKIHSKKNYKLPVAYKSMQGHGSTGRLTVSCAETSCNWIFYLQGM